MPPLKIGKIAQQAQVKKLMLSHFMLRTVNKKQESKRFIINPADKYIVYAA